MADKKLSELTTASSVGPTDLFYLAQSGTAKKLTATTLFSNLSNVSLNNKVKVAGEQVLTLPGVITTNSTVTRLTTAGSTGNLSIAAGEAGQIKIVTMTSATGGGSYNLNTGLAGNASVLFDKVGESALLLFTANAWHVIGGTATVTLP